MYEARLYIGDCVYKVISVDEPRDYIALYVPNALSFELGEPDVSKSVQCDQMIFRIHGRIEEFVLRYDFDTATKHLRLYEYEVTEVMPPTLAEPNENVNLDKLKAKLRDSLKTKELLIKYYASN